MPMVLSERIDDVSIDHKCEALELTMHELASKLADVLRMSVLDSSTAPAGDLPLATQRWSRLRALITVASAFTKAAATRALCLICLEEVSTRRGPPDLCAMP